MLQWEGQNLGEHLMAFLDEYQLQDTQLLLRSEESSRACTTQDTIPQETISSAAP